MKFPRPIKGHDEQNAYWGWRRVEFWQPGERSRIKRRTHKRERREGREAARKEAGDG